MTTISDLPGEVFYMVLEHMDKADLLQCQLVCRSWHLPVHKTFLKTVHLRGVDQIDQFIASIDCNPNPRYLACVKKIIIYIGDYNSRSIRYCLSKDDLKKLFFRFPNLELVKHAGFTDLAMYSEFNDDVCEDLLRSCPKLQSFKVSSYRPGLDHLLKLRRVATELELFNMFEIEDDYNIALYISSFSRLTSLCIASCSNLDTFEKFMPVFEQLPNLTKLEVQEVEQDRDKFAEQYLASRAKDEQEVLLERLAKVTDLIWENQYGICINSLKFITNYLIGLTNLKLSVNCTNSTINRQQYRLSCNSMMNPFCSTVECCISAKFRIRNLSEYLALILCKLYQQASRTGQKKTQEIEIVVLGDGNSENANIAELTITRTTNSSNRSITIKIKGKRSLDTLMTNVFPKAPSLNGVDYFEYKFLDDTDHENLLGVTIELA